MEKGPVIVKKPDYPQATWKRPLEAFRKGDEDTQQRGQRFKDVGTGFTEKEIKHGLNKKREIK